jgi:hypothetical protein
MMWVRLVGLRTVVVVVVVVVAVVVAISMVLVVFTGIFVVVAHRDLRDRGAKQVLRV